MNRRVVRYTVPKLIWKGRRRKVGLPPGTLVHIGEKKVEKVRITVIDYDEESFSEHEKESIEDCYRFVDKPTTTWINVDGLHEIDTFEELGKKFDLHPLVLEDVLNTGQRPKIDDYERYVFIVMKMLYYDEEGGTTTEQISLVVFPKFVISFQERSGDVFNQLRERIRSGKGIIRRMGSDYLAYAIIDAIVDSYFVILEKVGEEVENMEEDLIKRPGPEVLQRIHGLKTAMIFLRKSIWPLREVVNSLQRAESPIIKQRTVKYLRDVYDHTIQVIDTTETFRDMVSGMLDIYLSSVSNKMNEIMKVLTIIATIFIPLTFIAGVYGMNFRNMPELGWTWGYPIVWGVMGVIVILMVAYFRRKGWL